MSLPCEDDIIIGLRCAQRDSHAAAVAGGWWTDLETGASTLLTRNKPEMLALIHSEISEALEGLRKGTMDSHLPHRPSAEVELADALIRIFDLAGGLGLDLAGAYVEKRKYNDARDDHKIENRRGAGGKKF